ncbi:MAG: FeoB-associated Cys-rich membrane protein [Bacteroidales bacterium]|nr:FeoB-associated Cys-rich membrane protein [Bacteroidales bacterium]
MVQMVIVVLVLAVTLLFTGRAIVRTLKGKGDCGCGCDHCPNRPCQLSRRSSSASMACTTRS